MVIIPRATVGLSNMHITGTIYTVLFSNQYFSILAVTPQLLCCTWHRLPRHTFTKML